MKILETKSLAIEDIKVIKFARFKDNRGYFAEHYNWNDVDVIRDEIRQCNESYSYKGVMRGLHFQWNPYMGKLVRTVHGHMVDMVLDIRKESPTLGKIVLYNMPSDEDKDSGEWIWVPPGFAHGNLFLMDTTIEYLCTGTYSPGNEASISPLSIDIDWSLVDSKMVDAFNMVKEHVIMSDKDSKGITLTEWLDDKRSDNFIYGAVND